MRCYLKLLIPLTPLLFVACSGSQSSEDASQITRNEKGQILTPTQRTWAKDKIGKELSLQPNITDTLLQPMSIERFGQRLYVSDFSDMKIKKFSSDGEYLGSFGKEGRGPGEFQSIMDFDVRHDTLFVIDQRRRKFMLFDVESTEFITSRDTEFDPYRLAAMENEFIIEIGLDDRLFLRTDARLKENHRFGQFIENQKRNSMAISGEIEAVNDTGFVFGPSIGSYLYYFDGQGNRTKVIRTPDRIPLKEMEVREGGRVMRVPHTKVRTLGLSTVDDKLCVLQRYTKDDEKLPQSFMDLYELGSGRYLYSVKFSMPVSDAVFVDERFYVINNKNGRVRAFHYMF